MEEVKKQVDLVLDGFFYLFGFTENPASEATKEILDKSPAEKIKEDLKRVNKEYREQYSKMRKKVLCLE
ncbi:hypothetical protein [Flavihumibacter sp. CACIAM 22H1]|uniref:hypothetical protein n=1 Tax=Flavihumibacter sp. CACIAM 22H1 TaxID=1812911 RepID=UPI0007A8FD0E|nr:hypothetical protein [Flavihumibacter sp. CACIAM 22H1]KYP14369.1 MAG: hypothetical protein A1D16_11630 [Flavihumibacter sp. CACIAM 22H1]